MRTSLGVESDQRNSVSTHSIPSWQMIRRTGSKSRASHALQWYNKVVKEDNITWQNSESL